MDNTSLIARSGLTLGDGYARALCGAGAWSCNEVDALSADEIAQAQQRVPEVLTMASSPTTTLSPGVISSSMFNTPQAVDDFKSFTEDDLLLGTSPFLIDVMSNDAGGAAKSLWSLNAGTEASNITDQSSINDLISADVTTSGLSTEVDTTALGGKFWIQGGKIAYDPSSIPNLNNLGLNDPPLVDTITYAIRLANGTISLATLTVTIAGSNDGVSIVASTDAVGAVTEDDDDPTLSDTGVIAFTDPDWSDHHTTSVVADAGNTLGGAITMGAVSESDTTADGTVGWTYNVDNSATQHLGAGDTATESFTVTISDGHGKTVDQVVTVTVTGVNDAATISGGHADSFTEDVGPYTTSGALSVSDVDDGENTFASVLPADLVGDYGTFTFDEGTGEWGYTLNNASEAVQDLNAGDAVTDTLTVWSADGTDSETITITINGADEAPVEPTGPTLPTTYTGTGDPNDFDNLGNPSGTNIAGDANNNDLIYGGGGADVIRGNNGDDTIYAGSGNDDVDGNNAYDIVYGGSGNDLIKGSNFSDTLIGGYGADAIDGGGGNDVIVYLDVKDTNDTISNFEGAGVAGGDLIDLSALGLSGGFGGTSATSHGVWYSTSGGNSTVYVDTNGDTSSAELAITLVGVTTLVAGDFDLT
jgi:VCBS repeat-containing protein